MLETVDPAAGATTGAIALQPFLMAIKESVDVGDSKAITRLLGRLALEECQWQEFVHFEPFRHTRSLVALDASFSLMVCRLWSLKRLFRYA